jgi:uncharacterized damage-inducible protein DinB
MTAATSTMDTIVAQLSACHRVVHRNVDDVSNDEATVQPQPAGNTIFWVLRHITGTREKVLRSVGQSGFTATGETLEEILAAYDRSQPLIAAALGALTDDELDRNAPFSPGNNPNETVRSLLTVVAFHEAYHTGQLGVLRRLVGKEGAIKAPAAATA